MAKVVRFHEAGAPEVQIRIHAPGLNRAESMFRRGRYLEGPRFPARLGYEAAGSVAAIGPRSAATC
jgi:NADPH:quinone reductase-like Zn-dependent oxidoreductase